VRGLDDFPPAERTQTEKAMRALQLVKDAVAACYALHESLTTEQMGCEYKIGYSCDCLRDAAGYLEQVEKELRDRAAPTSEVVK
jgi:hypothetical protein